MTRRAFLRATLPRVLAIVFVMTATTVWATVTSIVMTPASPNPPILGTMFDFSPDNVATIKSVEWTTGSVFTKCTPPSWTDNNQTLNMGAQIPGSHSIHLVVKYQDPGMGQPIPPDTKHDRQFTVAPADDTIDVAGLGQLTANHSTVILELQVYAGDDPVGPAMIGEVQEKRVLQVRMGDNLLDTDWMPNSPAPTFNLTAGIIYDTHGESIPLLTFGGLMVDDPFYTATQELRILYTTPCGNEVIVPLPSRSIAHTKKNATQWCIE